MKWNWNRRFSGIWRFALNPLDAENSRVFGFFTVFSTIVTCVRDDRIGARDHRASLCQKAIPRSRRPSCVCHVAGNRDPWSDVIYGTAGRRVAGTGRSTERSLQRAGIHRPANGRHRLAGSSVDVKRGGTLQERGRPPSISSSSFSCLRAFSFMGFNKRLLCQFLDVIWTWGLVRQMHASPWRPLHDNFQEDHIFPPEMDDSKGNDD